MAVIDFIHFCDSAFLDQRGLPCLIGIRGSIGVARYPFPLASLTVAIGLRVAAGEEAQIRVEIGPADGTAQRAVNFRVQGPPDGGPLSEGLVFLPFQEVALYFAGPHIVVAKVIDGTAILATKSLHLFLEPPRSTAHP